MKRFISKVLCLAMIACVFVSLCACSNGNEVDSLVIYNSADYIYNYEDFEQEFSDYYKELTGKDIVITYVTYDTNETMLTKITKGDSIVDVVCPSDYAIQKMINDNLAVELDYFDKAKFTEDFVNVDMDKYVHYADNVEPMVMSSINSCQAFADIGMENYMVPYMYGTLGILYNKDKFVELFGEDDLAEVMNKSNWGLLFNDDGEGKLLSEDLTGTILMKDSIRDSYAVTLFYMLESGKLDGMTDDNGRLYTDYTMGEFINVTDQQVLDVCKEVMAEQKQQLFGYEVDFGKDDLLKGTAFVDLAWSGDAMYAVEESWNDETEDYSLAYYVPHDSGNIWFDGWVIPKTYNPAHVEAIKLFINFMNSPLAVAKNLVDIGYSSAVSSSVVQEDEEALAYLLEAYEYDADDPDAVDEFVAYFFRNEDVDGNCLDEVGYCNWRYPFETNDTESGYNRNIDTLGVMQDFGNRNKAVITMWNYARSAGVTAWGLLLWLVIALVAVGGVITLIVVIKRLKSHKIVLDKPTK